MKDMYAYMRPGIVSFKTFPDAMTGASGTIYDGVKTLAKDDFFQVMEVGWMHNWQERDRVAKLLSTTMMDVAYAMQPRTFSRGLNINSLDEAEREKSVSKIKTELKYAAHLGAERIRLPSGPDPGAEDREAAKDQLVTSLDEIAEEAAQYDIHVALKIFDRDIDKESLIGTFDDTADVAAAVAPRHDNFGLLVDYSHFPLLRTDPETALPKVEDWVTDFHIGNCILEPGHHAYGDKQPRFGAEYSENDLEGLAHFFEVLLDMGLLNTEDRPPVSVEVATQFAEDDPEVLVANSKRVWRNAWAIATAE